MPGTKGNSGGFRPGAGRKRTIKTVSEKTKNNYIKAARELAKEKGLTLEKAFLSMVYDKDVQDTVKASVMKSYNDALISRSTEQSISVHKESGPVIGLPPIKENPDLKIVKG